MKVLLNIGSVVLLMLATLCVVMAIAGLVLEFKHLFDPEYEPFLHYTAMGLFFAFMGILLVRASRYCLTKLEEMDPQ